MNTDIARLELCGSDGCAGISFPPKISAVNDGSNLNLAIEGANTRLTVAMIHAILLGVGRGGLRADAKIIWAFSSVEIVIRDLSVILERWRDTNEPPLLSIIALHLGDERHVTSGMAAFTGLEFAVEFTDWARSREAARNLARLARYALIKGNIERTTKYEAIDGRLLRLLWQDGPQSPAMVTIVF